MTRYLNIIDRGIIHVYGVGFNDPYHSKYFVFSVIQTTFLNKKIHNVDFQKQKAIFSWWITIFKYFLLKDKDTYLVKIWAHYTLI